MIPQQGRSRLPSGTWDDAGKGPARQAGPTAESCTVIQVQVCAKVGRISNPSYGLLLCLHLKTEEPNHRGSRAMGCILRRASCYAVQHPLPRYSGGEGKVRGDSTPREDSPSPPTPLPRSTGGEGSD